MMSESADPPNDCRPFQYGLADPLVETVLVTMAFSLVECSQKAWPFAVDAIALGVAAYSDRRLWDWSPRKICLVVVAALIVTALVPLAILPSRG